MSFDTLKLAELKDIAANFGVDLEQAKTKNEILAILAEEGVSYDMYKQFLDADKVEEEEDEVVVKTKPATKTKQSKETVLVRMDRANASYETYGYEFTREHPYVAIASDVAQEIFDNETGFRMATPREVQEFYS
jgi:hypothetical protein